jgi:hypothetical protein
MPPPRRKNTKHKSRDIEALVERLKHSPALLLLSILVVLLSSLITISSGISLLLGYYRQTLGYRLDLLRKVSSLALDTNIGYFKNRFGKRRSLTTSKTANLNIYSLTCCAMFKPLLTPMVACLDIQ